jgi:hypothetical protein
MKSIILLCLLFVAASIICLAQEDLRLINSNGVRLTVDKENDMAALRIHLPNEADSNQGIFVLFPEHVTAREHGKEDAVHLYLFGMGRQSTHPEWHRVGQSLEYEAELPQGISMKAQATLENDGIRYSYQFTNHSSVDYDMMQAVTDPRMASPYFKDLRLERTYVHHRNGFELLAAETAERISMPLNQWLPNRYRASYTWSVEAQRTTKGDDGITFYNKSRAVDEPFIATQSTDGQWVVATFSYDPGNVWSNPELTCQHADPQVALHPGQTREYEVKTLVMRGTLEQVVAAVRKQKAALRH